YAKCSRGPVERQDVGIIFTVGAEQNRDDLRVVKVSLWKERSKRPIDHARRKCFLFRRPPFALEITAGKFPHGCRLFAIINRQRKIILTFLDCCSRDCAGEHHGVAAGDDDGSDGESGHSAGFDRYLIDPDLGRDLLLHCTFPGCASSRPVTLTVGFNPALTGLKPKIQGYCGLDCCLCVFLTYLWLRAVKRLDTNCPKDQCAYLRRFSLSISFL